MRGVGKCLTQGFWGNMKLQYNQHPQPKLNLSKFAFLWIIVANLSAWARLDWAAGLLVRAAQSIWYLWVNHR